MEKDTHTETAGQRNDSWLVMLIRVWVIIIAVWSTHIKTPLLRHRGERAWVEMDIIEVETVTGLLR